LNFAKRIFLIAGIYGLIVLLPGFFTEARTGHDYPPAITHPEYYYGFLTVGIAWQLAFLIISRDPVRYRPIILAGVVEKWGFAAAAVALVFATTAGDCCIGIFYGGFHLWRAVPMGLRQNTAGSDALMEANIYCFAAAALKAAILAAALSTRS
jgi:hypothetical protein